MTKLKKLFSYKRIVEDLLKGVVDESLANEMTDLEMLDKEFVSKKIQIPLAGRVPDCYI